MDAGARASQRLPRGPVGSGRARTVTRTYEPGHDARIRYPDWVVRHRPLHGPREVLSWERRVILIASEQPWPAKRCSLAHALAHLDLDHRAVPANHRYERREEDAADQLAARRLMPIGVLVRLAPWTTHPAELLDALDVDAEMLRVRLTHMHPAERACIAAVLARREDSA